LDGDETKKNDVLAVEQWLLMKKTAFDASGLKRKCEDDDKYMPTTLPVATPIRGLTGSSIEALSPHELQSGGSHLPTAQPLTTAGCPGQLITPTRKVSSCQYPISANVTPQNYPGLSHLSPGLDLLRRGEVINGVD
jgi:hypothetical protein